MNTSPSRMLLATAIALLASAPAMLQAQTVNLTLSGKNEVPPVSTTAAGSGSITVAPDKSVSGSVKTTGVAGTMAHIHSGKAGENGPVLIPLTKEGDDTWKVPANSKLSDDGYKAFESGGLYVNVHSSAHPGGEIRSQLEAKSMAK